MATLYFNGAESSDWDEIGNWWTNAGHTTQATTLPTSSDSVVLSAACDTNSGSTPTVVNLTCNHVGSIGIAVTVTGHATFNDTSSLSCGGLITGNVTFNDYAVMDSGLCMAEVIGNATFNDNSYSYAGLVTGNATFNDNSYSVYGVVTGNATFSLTAADATIAYFGTYSSVSFAYEKGINGSSILGVI
jgi:hypothetical protein